MTAVLRQVGRPEDPALRTRREGEILEAATRMFAERGYAETQVQLIADELGVGNGTVYRYFPTKEKLFLAAVERGLNELTETMDAVMESGAEPLEMMRGAVRAYLRFFHRRPEMAELFIQERAAFRDHHRPLYFATKAEDESKHADFFERLNSAGLLREISPERFFSVIGDTLYGIVLTNLLSGRTVDPDEQANGVIDVLFHGVLSDSAKKKSTKSASKKGAS